MIFGEFDAHPEFLHFRCPGHNCIGLPNGWGRDKAGRDHPAGLLVFPACSNMLCIIPPGSNGCARAALQIGIVFLCWRALGAFFCNGVLYVEFRKGFCKECFEIQVWLSFPLFGDMLCLVFSNPAGRSGVFLRVVCFCASLLLYWGFVAFGRVKDRTELVP